jgi:beta-phosphoglucomutase-like phosphatase (HAD superfamily)
MTPDPALDAIIRQAQHLLFAFDGPIRSVDTGKPAEPATAAAPPAPYIHEVIAACRESGRSAVVISADSPTDVRAYLDAHDLSNQVTVVAGSISEAARALEASPAGCAVIASSLADIQAAQIAGTQVIGYARTSGDADRLVDAGAVTLVYSLVDLALRLRARVCDGSNNKPEPN